MFNKKAILVAAAAVSMMSTAASAQTNLVTNGTFSTTATGFNTSRQFVDEVTGWTNAVRPGQYTGYGYNFLIRPGTATTTGFTSRGGNTDWLYGANGTANRGDSYGSNLSANGFTGFSPAAAGAPAGSNGGNFLLLDGDTNFHGTVSQTLTGLTVGGQYRVTFDWAGISWFTTPGDTSHRLDVGFGAATQSTETLNLAPKGFSGWKVGSMTFTATGISQTLSFLAQGTPNGLPPALLLDNVSVVAVPEPATWAMMIVGVGAMGGALRTQRRRKAVVATA